MLRIYYYCKINSNYMLIKLGGKPCNRMTEIMAEYIEPLTRTHHDIKRVNKMCQCFRRTMVVEVRSVELK